MRSIAWILLIVYTLASFKALVPIIDYYANQDYIAKNLCENKDKPVLKCNGKCHLAKQLKKLDEEPLEQNAPSNKSNKNAEQDWTQVIPQSFKMLGLGKGKKGIYDAFLKMPLNRVSEVQVPPPIV